MNTSITGKQFELTEPIKNYVVSSFETLEKYNLDIISAKCIISADERQGKKGFSVELILNLAHKETVVIRQKNKDLYAAVDEATSRASKVLRREHDKRTTLKGKDDGKSERQSVGLEIAEIENIDEIVPMELELYKPLEIEEALNKLKDDENMQFFVFYDIDAKMRVLYKRKDGKFGLY